MGKQDLYVYFTMRKSRLSVVRWFTHSYIASKWQSRTRAPLAAPGLRPLELRGSVTSQDLGKLLCPHPQSTRKYDPAVVSKYFHTFSDTPSFKRWRLISLPLSGGWT